MKIKWLGHASFLITSQDNTRVITDPYNTAGGIKYGPIEEKADIVTVSHGHSDHNNIQTVKGSPAVLKEPGSQTRRGIEFKALSVFHDEAKGSKRGVNLIFCMKVDEINICHLGDLGHQLNQQLLAQLGPVDILMIPVGGYYTIDAEEATSAARSIKPRVIIPMHFKNPKCDYPISPVDDFLQSKKNIRKLNSSEAEYTKGTLPADTEILVLQPAL